MKPAPTESSVGERRITTSATLNETLLGEETCLPLRHLSRSIEPEPVAVTVIDTVITVDNALIGTGWTNYRALPRCGCR
jgi:hypothetical protein